MKKNVPKEFLEEYEKRRESLDSELKDLSDLIALRLAYLNSTKGTRGNLSDSRVKRPGKIWKKAKDKGFAADEAFRKIDDILGLRIVCHNSSDAQEIVNMFGYEGGVIKINEVKDMVSDPEDDGYRAIHIRAETTGFHPDHGGGTPCEIQIRTLAQDTWARLSRADLYGRQLPSMLTNLTKTLSEQLSTIDKIAQLIRDELNKPVKTAQELKDSDPVSPQRLALLFKQKYKEELFEWTQQVWVENLKEAEVERIEEVKKILDDNQLRKALDDISNGIRRFDLNNSEWAIYSALVYSEVDEPAGIRAAISRIQKEWDEITTIARNETLPESIKGFLNDLKGSSISQDHFLVLDCITECFRCGAPVLVSTENVIESICYHYDTAEYEEELYELIEDWRIKNDASMDGMFCSYCEYIASKDD